MITSCDRCWKLPCECGHDYKGLSTYQIREMIKALTSQLGIAALKEIDSRNDWGDPGSR